jgi:hypothetical protein
MEEYTLYRTYSKDCGWVEKPVGEAKTYESFVGTVLRIEGLK